jgi:hypothetical protein
VPVEGRGDRAGCQGVGVFEGVGDGCEVGHPLYDDDRAGLVGFVAEDAHAELTAAGGGELVTEGR